MISPWTDIDCQVAKHKISVISVADTSCVKSDFDTS